MKNVISMLPIWMKERQKCIVCILSNREDMFQG